MQSKTCTICGSVFNRRKILDKGARWTTRQTCSVACGRVLTGNKLKGSKRPKEVRDKISAALMGHKGVKHTKETKTSISKSMSGEGSPNWRGDEAGYVAIHMWVSKLKGKPSFCEHCDTKDSARFEWANIDHKYKRKLDDYVRLCYKCHYKYDKTLRRKQKGI